LSNLLLVEEEVVVVVVAGAVEALAAQLLVEVQQVVAR